MKYIKCDVVSARRALVGDKFKPKFVPLKGLCKEIVLFKSR